ncbi:MULTISPECIES: YcbX family protein [Tatumella]|uniref:YcbX family protein n=1 Tax=Tatumella punctata TaxID=399969 RepID=A0ABW1VR52_9GAMM|nr:MULTISPECIES: YcbX family protein [unclassified Tatumella]MBS0854748.1 YcbX family protein [Tatumella sp. JGM16]MBS0878136.1 YcbX family protein [Tatumella sp. JGM82]MBS0889890.1 YcbX family protein [Tatumella sp. JGM94]MBS0892471.1 YcbX family protein [Tatumella sp. JGM130]MBS0902849.1 YcbX family protein [Tatumella sp. JGM100]
MISLSRLFIHPVKSMRGTAVSQSLVQPQGLSWDRMFMVTTTEGKFITARQYPEMVLFTPLVQPEGLFIQAPDNSQVLVRFDDFSPQVEPAEVWGSNFASCIAPEVINQWLSRFFPHPVQLRWTGIKPARRVRRFPEIPVGFADGYPFLLINQSSFYDLQNRCPAGIRLEQFRPNLVVAGASAWDEDQWSVIRVGDITFDVAKPCSRCIFTTVSTERGVKHPSGEPMTTLKMFRLAADSSGDIDFGLNLIARNSGVIRCGDDVTVLARKPARPYTVTQRQQTVARPETDNAIIDIRYQGKSFRGNNQQILLEQLEAAGFSIPYSCRAGACGCCRLTLVSGEVTALNASGVNGDKVLSCSCIPRSAVVLESD